MLATNATLRESKSIHIGVSKTGNIQTIIDFKLYKELLGKNLHSINSLTPQSTHLERTSLFKAQEAFT
jgi:hypothetical protein